MEFKPRLEKIIKEVIVVSEVATIAEEVQLLEESGENLDEVEFKSATVVEQHRTNHNNRTGGWKGVTFRHNNNHEEGGGGGTTAAAASVSSMDDEEDEEDDSYRNARRATFRGTRPQLSTTESGSWRIKKFLDRWEDPVDKSERDPEVTIADVLKFRTSITLSLSLSHPHPHPPTHTHTDIYINRTKLSSSKAHGQKGSFGGCRQARQNQRHQHAGIPIRLQQDGTRIDAREGRPKEPPVLIKLGRAMQDGKIQGGPGGNDKGPSFGLNRKKGEIGSQAFHAQARASDQPINEAPLNDPRQFQRDHLSRHEQ